MSFDSHSLERLKDLGRKLPKEITKPKLFKQKNLASHENKNLHPVEIEENPEQLFHELMDISHDGNVPVHLINRLKQIETHDLEIDSCASDYVNLNIQSEQKKIKDKHSSNLYTEFNHLLLEDDV